MSLRAGGVGLNLTAASNVFIMVLDYLNTDRFSLGNALDSILRYVLATLISYVGSVVESCSRGAGDHEDSSDRTEENCYCQAVHCQGD